MNKWIEPDENFLVLTGHLGNDAELSINTRGKKLKFSLAVADYYKGRDAFEEKVLWILVEVFGNLAEHHAALKKGDKILCRGKLCCRHWKDADGSDKDTWSILANTISLLSKKQ